MSFHVSGHVPFQTPRGPEVRSLTSAAHDWLARLPPRYQPLATARRHPHIVNRLCALWDTPSQRSAYFHELMLVNLKQRAGFSFEVLTELTDLQAMLEPPQRRRRH